MMEEEMRFGISMSEFRTDFGALRTGELEKIVSFLYRRGVLIADCFDRKIVIVHPSLVKDIQEKMLNAGFQLLLIGSTAASIRKRENLNLAQNRVLEMLTPGALIIARSDDKNPNLISVAIPDNLDLRDICSSYEGTIQVFITNTSIEENELTELLGKIELNGLNLNKIGVLEYPYADENPDNRIATVAYIYGPNNIKLVKAGAYDLDTVKQASAKFSQYEIGEWT